MKTSYRITKAIVFGSFLGLASVAQGAARIDVDPAVRAQPQWFWQGPDAKCVAVSSQDLISRIAPRILRENKITADKTLCRLQTGERRIEAQLACNGKSLQTFFLKEELCTAQNDSPATK